MGLFRKSRKASHSLATRNFQTQSSSPGIRHRASWAQNGVTFVLYKKGPSWSFDSEANSNDHMMAQAALGQLEEAYHMNVSFPGVEERLLSVWRVFTPEMGSDARLAFNWRPPLPNNYLS